MDRAFLALINKRLKALEKAQLDHVEARVNGVPNAYLATTTACQQQLADALRGWMFYLAATSPTTGLTDETEAHPGTQHPPLPAAGDGAPPE